MIAPLPCSLSFVKENLQNLQAAFVVRDLEESMLRYRRLLGIGPWSIYTYDRTILRRASYQGREADYSMRLALASFENGSIELIQHLAGDSIYADFIRTHGYGFHHFGLTVEDAAPVLAEAESAGLTVIQDGSGFGMEGDGYFAYLDSQELLGVVLEIRVPPRKRRPPDRMFPICEK
jgi:methylmalonyl-CoA/ethylmalonyl-CoA epimerase